MQEGTAENEPISVLVVDDNEPALTAMTSALACLGHRLVTASSGYEALHRAERDDFAAIVIDVQMPELDGFETAVLLRESVRVRPPPLIFVSETEDDLATIRRGYALGAV